MLLPLARTVRGVSVAESGRGVVSAQTSLMQLIVEFPRLNAVHNLEQRAVLAFSTYAILSVARTLSNCAQTQHVVNATC